MLELRPTCEIRNTPLPPDLDRRPAFCSYECIVLRYLRRERVAERVCPNCACGSSQRPIKARA